MFKLLVVEDKIDFYEGYLLRIFETLLPMEKISVTHVPTLGAATAVLLEPWDAMLVDFSLGARVKFDDETIRDGGDLIAYRRGAEKDQRVPKTLILGMSSNQAGNRAMKDRGADGTVLKIQVPEMAALIKGALKQGG